MNPITEYIEDLTFWAEFLGFEVFTTNSGRSVTGRLFKTVYVRTGASVVEMEEFLVADTVLNGVVIHADVHTFGTTAIVGTKMPVKQYPLAHHMYLNTSIDKRKYI